MDENVFKCLDCDNWAWYSLHLKASKFVKMAPPVLISDKASLISH